MTNVYPAKKEFICQLYLCYLNISMCYFNISLVIIKHILKLSDRETIQQIRENVFMQYFLSYSSFTNEVPFSPTLFGEIRERLTLEVMGRISELIITHHLDKDFLMIIRYCAKEIYWER